MTDPHTTLIRPATPDDAPALARLRHTFRAELGTVVETAAEFEERASRWFAVHLTEPTWHAWVAVDAADTLVGHAFLHLIAKIPNPVIEAEQIGYITNVYVLPVARARGLGRRLVQAALDRCAAEQVDSIILWPSARSRPLYERLGFRPATRLLERPAATPEHTE